MSCREMTGRMLEAELDELTGIGDAMLARHVRRCVACRRAARRIVAGTRRLAVDVGTEARATVARPRSTGGRRGLLLVGSAAAAAVALLVADRTGDAVGDLALPPAVALVARPPAIPISAAPPVARLAASADRSRIPRRHAGATAAAFAAVPPIPEPVPHVSIDVPPGRQALVMRTANPLVTVVWLR